MKTRALGSGDMARTPGGALAHAAHEVMINPRDNARAQATAGGLPGRSRSSQGRTDFIETGRAAGLADDPAKARLIRDVSPDTSIESGEGGIRRELVSPHCSRPQKSVSDLWGQTRIPVLCRSLPVFAVLEAQIWNSIWNSHQGTAESKRDYVVCFVTFICSG